LASASYRKFYHETHEDIDIPFYAEAFVAMYRFLPPEDCLPLFVDCLRPERSDAVKTCIVRAYLILVNEVSPMLSCDYMKLKIFKAPHIPWQRSLDPFEDATAERMHELVIVSGHFTWITLAC
jgi:hypothetical protein